MLITDPGRPGKDRHRPGLVQLLEMVDDGHVTNVLVWRLDRLSRNLGDLICLADRFGQRGISLHSFTEKLDLSSATGRMFKTSSDRSLSSIESNSPRTSDSAHAKPTPKAAGPTGHPRATTSTTAS